jgi:hypothetical protein
VTVLEAWRCVTGVGFIGAGAGCVGAAGAGAGCVGAAAAWVLTAVVAGCEDAVGLGVECPPSATTRPAATAAMTPPPAAIAATGCSSWRRGAATASSAVVITGSADQAYSGAAAWPITVAPVSSNWRTGAGRVFASHQSLTWLCASRSNMTMFLDVSAPRLFLMACCIRS